MKCVLELDCRPGTFERVVMLLLLEALLLFSAPLHKNCAVTQFSIGQIKVSVESGMYALDEMESLSQMVFGSTCDKKYGSNTAIKDKLPFMRLLTVIVAIAIALTLKTLKRQLVLIPDHTLSFLFLLYMQIICSGILLHRPITYIP